MTAVAVQPILSVDSLSKRYRSRNGEFWAVRDVSLDLAAGECLALVGESGSGKTTLAQMIVGLTAPTSGSATVEGTLDVTRLARSRRGRQTVASRVQLVFQDTYGSLDPAKRIADIVAEPLRVLGWSKDSITTRLSEVFALVSLPEAYWARRPRELSGGQRQRVGIARGLAPNPRLLVLDEPVASLDVSIQGQVLSLLKTVQEATGVSLLVISHDLGVVRAIADRTLVMYLGSLVESGPTPALFGRPAHPYTQALLWSASAEGRARTPATAAATLARDPLPAAQRDVGCVFRSRCWVALEECQVAVTTVLGAARMVSCNVPLDDVTAEEW